MTGGSGNELTTYTGMMDGSGVAEGDNSFPIAVVIGASVGGAAIILLLVCCVSVMVFAVIKRRRSSSLYASVKKPKGQKEGITNAMYGCKSV